MLIKKQLLGFFGIFLVLFLIVFSYENALDNGFVWDDIQFFEENPTRWLGRNVEIFSLKIIPLGEDYYRPMTLFSYALQSDSNQVGSFNLHLVNLLLHLANATLVGLIVYSALIHKKANYNAIFPALSGALIYGLHAGLIEGVVWVSGRFDLFIAFWGLLIIWINTSSISRTPLTILTGLCFFMAALSKESALGIALMLPIFHLFKEKIILSRADTSIQILQEKSRVYFAIICAGIAYLFLRSKALGHIYNYHPNGDWQNPIAKTLTIFNTLADYTLIVFWPFFHISPIHPIDEAFFPSSVIGYALMFFCILFFGALLIAKRKSPWLLLVSCVFFSLSPALNIFTIPGWKNLAQERYLQFPLGVAISLGVIMLCIFPPLQTSKKMGRIVAGFFFLYVALSLITIKSVVPMWKSELSLWSWVTLQHPRNALAWYNLGVEQWDEGAYESSARSLEKALELAGDDNALKSKIYSNLGIINLMIQKPYIALSNYDKSINLNPKDINPLIDVAEIYLRLKLPHTAKQYIDQANEFPDSIKNARLACIEARYNICTNKEGIAQNLYKKCIALSNNRSEKEIAESVLTKLQSGTFEFPYYSDEVISNRKLAN